MIKNLQKESNVSTRFIKATAKNAISKIKSSADYDKLTLKDIEEMSIDVVEGEIPEKAKEMLRLTVIATLWIDKCGIKHVTERLRYGYIGKKSEVNGFICYQSKRGEPYGTMVSLPSKDGRAVIGISYANKNDKHLIPIIGEYIALKRAIDGQRDGFHGAEPKFVKPCAKAQIEHFYKKSLAYWNPEKYSHSRGTEPVSFDNYDEIHSVMLNILGKEKMACMSTLPPKADIAMYQLKGTFNDSSDIAALMSNKHKHGDYYICNCSHLEIFPTDDFKTKTKKSLELYKNDWLVFTNGVWSVIPVSNKKTDKYVSKSLKKTES